MSLTSVVNNSCPSAMTSSTRIEISSVSDAPLSISRRSRRSPAFETAAASGSALRQDGTASPTGGVAVSWSALMRQQWDAMEKHRIVVDYLPHCGKVHTNMFMLIHERKRCKANGHMWCRPMPHHLFSQSLLEHGLHSYNFKKRLKYRRTEVCPKHWSESFGTHDVTFNAGTSP